MCGFPVFARGASLNLEKGLGRHHDRPIGGLYLIRYESTLLGFSYSGPGDQ